MGSRWSQRVRLASGLSMILAGAGMSAGCMEARPAINRVQPDFLDKTQLIPVQYDLLTRAGRTPTQLTREDLRREPIWAHQITIIDKPATTGQQGISWYTDMEKINWEVTESFLIARRAYDRLNRAENVTGSANPFPGDNDTNISGNPRNGEILAVYRIQSHFDIRRSYNPQTGEELNVVEENGSDRPWYQRRYVRVDWSQNLVGGYSAMSYAEWTGKVRAEPTPLYINDPTDPNAPVFNYETRGGQANTLTYFDVTNRMTLHPEEVNLAQRGYPNLPACVLSPTGIESCQPADVHFRVAFMRLDPERDYEAQAIDGLRMDRFGFFEGGRLGYNRDRQDILNTERRHFAFRHNLWKNHHMPRTQGATGLAGGELNGGAVACHYATDCQSVSRTAECSGGTATTEGRCVDRFALCRQDSDCAGQDRGARCDTGASYSRGDGNGVCLLPYRDRDVRQIPYHLSPNYPDRIMPVTNQIVRDWNRAFSDAVGQARRRECVLDPNVADKTSCDQYLAFDPVQRESDAVGTAQGAMLPSGRAQDGQWVYVGCHTPVWGTDPNLPGHHTQEQVTTAHNSGWDLESCGPQGTVARLGDIRYSMIASINEYDRQGAWGLANISGDPETGEVYSARGAVWQTITDLQANNTIDMLRVLNGETTPDQIANGESIREIYPGLGENAGRQARGGQDGVPSSNLPAMRSHVRSVASMDEVRSIVAASQMEHLDVGQQQGPSATGGQLGVLAGAGVANLNDLARDPGTGRLTEAAFRYNGMHRWNRTGVSPMLSSGQNDLATRLGRIAGTEIEDRLMNNSQLALGGQDPRLSGVLPQARDVASPARRWNQRMRQVQAEIERAGSQHQCNMEHDPIAAYDDTELKFYLASFKANRVPYGLTFGETWDFTTGAGDGGINWDSARRWLVQYIHYPVMLHELGHSIGQRHNFASSADAFNYNDRYWAIRARRHNGDSRMIRPRWEYQAAGEPEFTQEEQDLGEEAVAYSSIMDYKTTEGRGLGRYDFAFVMHGYVNMVEAFKEVANRDRALNLFNTYSGAGQQPLSFGLSGNDTRNLRLTSFHYSEIPSVVGTSMQTVQVHPGVEVSGQLPNLTQANRFPVFLDETRRVAYNGFMWDPDHTNEATRGPDGNAGAFLLVPYRFETDDYAGDYWYNSRYDAGADFYEVMRYFGSRYLDYYPFASFGRERASFSISGYVGRMQGRYLDNMYYIMRVAAIYEGFYRQIFAAVTNYNEWKQQTASVAQALGTSTVFDTFTTALLMPEWNRFGTIYTARTRPEDGQRFFDEAGFGESGAFEMPIGEGRQYQSTYDYASGRFWRERLVNAGSYYDKIMALQYMTDTFLYSVNRDLDQDLRTYQVNVYTVYPGQTLRLFGSILSEDHADIGPQARIRGRDVSMVRTNLSLLNLPAGTGMGQNGRDPALTPVNPNLGFTTNLWAAVFGMAGLSGSYDQRFVQSARMWADGDPFAATLPAGETVTFRDPVTGLTYRAIKQTTQTPGASNLDPGVSGRESARPMAGDGTNYPGERGIAARMILRANDLLRFANSQAPNTPARNRAFTQLQQYVDLLNVMRFLNSRFGTGGQVGGGGFTGGED